jgi:radical SAM superfamily enzyme YgiQ (UPF0313 family)
MALLKVILPTFLSPALSGMRLGLTGLIQSITSQQPKVSAEVFHLNYQSLRRIENAKVIIFSISNPLEYDLVFEFCKKAKIPTHAAQRSDDMPIFVGGGMGFTNPEPLAELFDIIILGLSFQPLISLLDTIELTETKSKRTLLGKLCKIPNLYIPSLIHPEYLPDGRMKSMKAEYKLIRQKFFETPRPLSGKAKADEAILMPDIGCRNKCSFCALTHFYDYEASQIDDLKSEIDKLSSQGITKIKINSATAFQYSNISDLLQHIKDAGLSLALGSVRIDEVSELQLGILNSIHRISDTQFLYRAKPFNGGASLTFGIESASNRLLRMINKHLDCETIKEQICSLTKNGLKNLGYYLISGIPTETYKDILAVSDLIAFTICACEAVKGEVFINVNPLIPSPNTPMQRVEIISEDRFKEWITTVQESVRASIGDESFKSRVHFGHMPLDHLLFETITMRSDRRISSFLELFYESRENAKLDDARASQLLNDANLPDLNFYRRRISKDEILPWQLVLPRQIAVAENAYYKREEEALRAIA